MRHDATRLMDDATYAPHHLTTTLKVDNSSSKLASFPHNLILDPSYVSVSGARLARLCTFPPALSLCITPAFMDALFLSRSRTLSLPHTPACAVCRVLVSNDSLLGTLHLYVPQRILHKTSMNSIFKTTLTAVDPSQSPRISPHTLRTPSVTSSTSHAVSLSLSHTHFISVSLGGWVSR